MNTKVKKFIAVSLIGITTIGNVPTIAFADSAPITPYTELTLNTLDQKYLYNIADALGVRAGDLLNATLPPTK